MPQTMKVYVSLRVTHCCTVEMGIIPCLPAYLQDRDGNTSGSFENVKSVLRSNGLNFHRASFAADNANVKSWRHESVYKLMENVN